MSRLSRIVLMVLIVLGVLWIVKGMAQNHDRTLVVNGKPLTTNVIQREGRFYGDLESIAHALGGSISLQPNQVELSVAPQPATPQAQSNAVLSQDFQRASIAALGDMRQWEGAVSELISTGVPVAGQWPRENRDRVAHQVMQASVAASTNADHQALALLQKLQTHLADWSETVVAERKAMRGNRFRDPNAPQNDPALAKINKCGEFLAEMMVHGVFADDASCH